MEDILQQGGQITLTALGSLAALFLLTKLSGNKQVSQMNLFDYVMGITIGSIAAEMASELESPLRPLWAMVVYGLAAWGIALLTNRSIRVRRFITGKVFIRKAADPHGQRCHLPEKPAASPDGSQRISHVLPGVGVF